MLNKVIRNIKHILFTKYENKPSDVIHTIGSIEIILPIDHALPIYQSKYNAYDKHIGVIAKIIEQNKNNCICIDIGANVGDTAAAIRQHSQVCIIAIEGNPYYLEYLKKNAITIGKVQIIDYLVGTDQIEVTDYALKNDAGTAKLVNSSDSKQLLKFRDLENIIQNYDINRSQIGLIKIDTDGFDFKIILANKRLINEIRPIIFFEYDFSFSVHGEDEANQVIELFKQENYEFLVFDNFGNLLYDLPKINSLFFVNINKYIKSCKENGGGIYYLDILAVPREYRIIKEQFLFTMDQNDEKNNQ